MSQAWDTGGHPEMHALRGLDWVRVPLRALALVVLVFGCLILLLLVRLIERPIYGVHRPVTPHITQFVCRNAFRILGMKIKITGAPMPMPGAVVANHSSWLDIFALNVAKRIYFVSKSEVASWPGIGWLARATGTVFIERNPVRARAQTQLFQERLLAGHKLLFFPEGTSTDGLQVLPFKTTLFQSFLTPELRNEIAIQPVAVLYRAPEGRDPRFYGWWGDMALAPHLIATLAPARQGSVQVIYGDPLMVRDYPDRKTLAAACERQVRAAHSSALGAARLKADR